MEKISKADALSLLEIFCNDIQSVMLSSVNNDGEPFVSYAPFVEDEQHHYYIGVSEIVPHTHNLQATKKAHIMFIEDESNARGIFFRRRLYGKAQAVLIDDAENIANVSQRFVARFGAEAGMIMALPDFKIFRLEPSDMSFVLGFGAAYSVSDDRKTLRQKTGGKRR